jgi:tripartite-type tricarboxylate transporter receptor subunit TctC
MPDTSNHPRRRVLQIAAAAAASLALPLRAQSGFPSGPLRIIVGVPAGGAADVGARALAAALERNIKQPVIVENRTGGNFLIAWQALQAAPADGHTLMHIFNTFPALHAVQKLFDLEKQVAHITLAATSPVVLLVKGDSPHKTLGELVGFGRANPGKLSYVTTGVGTGEHLKMAQFERVGGFKGLAVPFRGGPDAIKALLGGDINFMMAPAIFAKQFAPSGQVRVLAMMDGVRWKDMPDVPTFAEAGVNLPPMTYWGGYVARAGIPPEIVQRLHREVSAAALDPSVVEKMAASGQSAVVSKSPDDFRQFIVSEIAWMTEAAKGLDLKS